MRSSDWSSEVCSSDLAWAACRQIGEGNAFLRGRIGRDQIEFVVAVGVDGHPEDIGTVRSFGQKLGAQKVARTVHDIGLGVSDAFDRRTGNVVVAGSVGSECEIGRASGRARVCQYV